MPDFTKLITEMQQEYPIYDLVLPSNQQKISYRPFVEKERKILLMAIESGQEKDMINAVKQIIKNCCLVDLNVEELPLFDIEYLFINIRAKSIGEIQKLFFQCNNEVEGKACGNVIETEVNLTEVQVENIKTNLKLPLSSTIGIMMKYPTTKVLDTDYDTESREYLYECLSKMVDYVWNGENIYYAKDASKEDMIKFFESLSVNQFDKVEKFFDDLPTVKKILKYKCNKCGFDHVSVLEGFESFFV